jgi:hypothetical protein
MAQAEIRRTVTNHINEIWDKKCVEIQSYLGCKKSSEFWKFNKNTRSSNSGKSQLNLLSADTWERYNYTLFVEDRKGFLGKKLKVMGKKI